MKLRELTVSVEVYDPAGFAPPPGGDPPNVVAEQAAAGSIRAGAAYVEGATPAGIGDGSLIDLGAALLKAWLRRKGIITAVLVAAALLGAAGDAAAFGRRCGGGQCGQSADQPRGPVRGLIARVADRVQARRGGTCATPPAVYPPSYPPGADVPEAAPYRVQPVGAPSYVLPQSCPGGVCPAPAYRR